MSLYLLERSFFMFSRSLLIFAIASAFFHVMRSVCRLISNQHFLCNLRVGQSRLTWNGTSLRPQCWHFPVGDLSCFCDMFYIYTNETQKFSVIICHIVLYDTHYSKNLRNKLFYCWDSGMKGSKIDKCNPKAWGGRYAFISAKIIPVYPHRKEGHFFPVGILRKVKIYKI